MINFDYKENLAMIKEVFKTSNSAYRDKEAFVACRGTGGGLTRTLEELKMMTNRDIPESLAIAITYKAGSPWALDSLEIVDYAVKLYPEDAYELKGNIDYGFCAEVGIVFSMVTRLTSMLYGCPFNHAKALHLSNLSTFPEISIFYVPLVLIGFMKSVVEELRAAGRPISNVLFLIDETLEYNDLIHQLGGDGWRRDYWYAIKDKVLGPNFTTYAGVSTALVLSTVDYSDISLHLGATRPLTAIPLPGKLSNTAIVKDWWLPLITRSGLSIPEDQIPVLEVYAAACEQSPGAVELFGESLVNRLKVVSTLSPVAYDALLTDTLAKIKTGYPSVKELPTGVCLHALLCGRVIRAFPEVRQLMRTGMFSNRYNYIVPIRDGDKPPWLVPETSFIVLAASAMQSQPANKQHSIHGPEAAVVEIIVTLYHSFVRLVVAGEFDALSKQILTSALKMALLVDAYYADTALHYSDELNFHKLFKVTDDVRFRLGLYGFYSPLPKGPGLTEVPLPCSVADKSGFYCTLADPANMPSKDQVYVLFYPTNPGSCSFDLMLAAYTGPESPPQILVFQYSSPDCAQREMEAPAAEQDVSVCKGKQYEAARSLLMSDPLPADVPVTGLLKLIREGKVRQERDARVDGWVYVYVGRDEKCTEPRIDGNCLVLGPTDAAWVCAPFRSIYEACLRASESAAIKRNQQV